MRHLIYLADTDTWEKRKIFECNNCEEALNKYVYFQGIYPSIRLSAYLVDQYGETHYWFSGYYKSKRGDRS